MSGITLWAFVNIAGSVALAASMPGIMRYSEGSIESRYMAGDSGMRRAFADIVMIACAANVGLNIWLLIQVARAAMEASGAIG